MASEARPWSGWRPRRSTAAIPSADAPAFRRAALRNRIARILLALALVAVLALAYVSARGLEVREGGFLPVGTTGVVVIDLSASVGQAANRRIAGVLENAVRSDQPTGLVLFSDTAYELVPPGTPGAALRPLVRYFTPRHLSRTQRLKVLARAGRPEDVFPRNPWQDDFRGGTRISAGLRLAATMLRRDHVQRGSVLLISDLDYSSGDSSALTRTLIGYRLRGLRLRIVPLFPSAQDRELFSRLLGRNALVNWKELKPAVTGKTEVRSSGAVPTGLIASAVVIALLLALNELWCVRLPLPGRSRP